MGTDYRSTKWGAVCVDLWTEVAKTFPDLAFAVGPDEGASHAAAPVLSFDHAGGETVQPALRGGASTRHPFDRLPAIGFEAWGSTPVETEAIYESLLLAIDTVAHGRAGKPGAVKPEIGSLTSGQQGTKYTGSFLVRIAVMGPVTPTQRAESRDITGAVGPDGGAAESTHLG